MANADRLPADEDHVWRDLIRISTILPRVLDTQLRRQTTLTLSEFGVLLHLAEAEGGEMRMSDIAFRVGLSASRITRAVSGLRSRKLVEQRQGIDDARSSIAGITDSGRVELARAYHVQVSGARNLIFDRVDAAEVASTGKVLDVLVRQLRLADGTGVVSPE